MQKRTEITIETDRFLVISRRRSERARLWCDRCASTLPMLTVEVAARIARTTPPVILQLVEADKLHSAVTAAGRLFICSNSLAFERPEETTQRESDINSTF
jgi:hypothetical protein